MRRPRPVVTLAGAAHGDRTVGVAPEFGWTNGEEVVIGDDTQGEALAGHGDNETDLAIVLRLVHKAVDFRKFSFRESHWEAAKERRGATEC